MTTAATTIICSRDMCFLTLSPSSLGPQSAKEKARRGGPALRNPPQLARLDASATNSARVIGPFF